MKSKLDSFKHFRQHLHKPNAGQLRLLKQGRRNAKGSEYTMWTRNSLARLHRSKARHNYYQDIHNSAVAQPRPPVYAVLLIHPGGA